MQFKKNSLTIHSFPSGPFRTNAYLVVCEETKEAVVIDPASGSFEKIKELVKAEQLTVSKVILTHSHWDHIADTSLFAQEWNPPICINPEDAPNLIQPGSDNIPYWISIQGVLPTVLLHEGDSFSIGNSEWKVIHTPGHSPGGICLFCEKEQLLFAGDSLFKGTCGNLSLPTGEPERMWPSLKKLSYLPDNTVVFSGHGPSTTIGDEPWLDQAETLFGKE